MCKSDYRIYFANVIKYIKITSILDDLNISRSNFSKFLNYDNEISNTLISVEKLEQLKQRIKEIALELI